MGFEPFKTPHSSKVLIVSNLPNSKDINPYTLFKLFGLYGNVMKVKILYKPHRDSALIEFENSEQAN